MREDILRGVRLFAIVFAAILVCVAAYRILHPVVEAQSVAPPPSDVVQPAPEAAPVAETEQETHPLVVPEPPPVPGTVRAHVTRPKVKDVDVPPPPPLAAASRVRRTPAPKEFDSSEAVALPSAPVEESPEAKPLTPQQAVGYKSLIDANPNRAPLDASPSPADESDAKPKGNRFFRAIGKIFHPASKKETLPLTLQPKP